MELTMRLYTTSIFVDDQRHALDFYTKVLGFLPKHDEPVGEDRWLTVVSGSDPDGVELVLEPSLHPAKRAFKDALVAEGIPAAMFRVDDLHTEYQRLTELGIKFSGKPQDAGKYRVAIFDDTCGNLVQLIQLVD
jgi:catechol 2,3-dioxygenase-like lactoylglutathione lyase family enzyme